VTKPARPRKVQSRHIHPALFARNRFGALEDETGCVFDSHRFGLLCDRILYRLERDAERVADPDRAVTPVKIELNPCEHRFEHFGEGRREDFKRQPARLTGADGQDRFTLLRARPLIDEQGERAVSFVNRFRPVGSEGDRDAVQ
jgi:hypothetical protein